MKNQLITIVKDFSFKFAHKFSFYFKNFNLKVLITQAKYVFSACDADFNQKLSFNLIKSDCYYINNLVIRT